jgi:hypothetical protein
VLAGRDYPDDLSSYRLVIHCGACMLNRRAMLNRLRQADAARVPVTNYGLAIAAAHGAGERVLEPFPRALAAYRQHMPAGSARGNVSAVRNAVPSPGRSAGEE